MKGVKGILGNLSSQGALKEFPYGGEGLMESLEMGKASRKRMETRRRQSFPGAVKGGLGKQRVLGEEKGSRKQYPQTLALLRGRAGGNISS